MTRWFGWFASLGLICAVAQARVSCPPLFQLEGNENTYYVLVFLDPSSKQEPYPKQELDRLKTRVSPLLNDIPRKLAANSGSKRRVRIELVACEYQVGSGDFSIEEMKEWLGYRVVSVFWKSREGDKPGLVQLAVPVYLRSDGATRREAEVVTLYAGKAADPIDAWTEVLGQDSALYKPFVMMGLAKVYQQESGNYKPEYKTASMALCDSRNGLVSLAANTLHPKPEDLDNDITAPLIALMKDLEHAARLAGISPLPACPVLASHP
jgi:hypothetical protein